MSIFDQWVLHVHPKECSYLRILQVTETENIIWAGIMPAHYSYIKDKMILF